MSVHETLTPSRADALLLRAPSRSQSNSAADFRAATEDLVRRTDNPTASRLIARAADEPAVDLDPLIFRKPAAPAPSAQAASAAHRTNDASAQPMTAASGSNHAFAAATPLTTRSVSALPAVDIAAITDAVMHRISRGIELHRRRRGVL
jgi:hypothetical protein